MKRILLAVFVCAVAVASLQPARPGVWSAHYGAIHRVLHLACFGLLAFLSQKAFPERRWLAPIALMCVGFGAVLESSQMLLYGNGFEWADLVDDSVGALVGLGAGLVAARLSE